MAQSREIQTTRKRFFEQGTRRSSIARTAVLLVSSLIASCTSGDPGGESPNVSSPAGTSDISSPSPTPDPFADLAAPPKPKKANIPPITSVDDAGGETIHASHSADWTLVAYGVAWVTGLEVGIGRFDVETGKQLDPVAVEGRPCAAMDFGFGAVWTATCGNPGVARIDRDGTRVERLDFDLAANDGESSIGVGEGAVWAIAEAEDFSCVTCRLVRIDPRDQKIEESYPIPDGATAVRAGEGGVWVVYSDENAVVHIDPDSGEVVAAIAVGDHPLFFDVGAGGVWVMNQGDGTVSHIDPRKNTVRATIAVDEVIEGGDLTVGDDGVWLRASDELVAWIDPHTDSVLARYGEPEGSGSASAGDGQLWISAHDVARLYRIPLD